MNFCLSNLDLGAQSNEGVDFWFGFMEHVDANFNSKKVMITSKYNTSGIVSMPNQDWSESFSVLANDVVLITLPYNSENIGSEVIKDIGLRLTALDPVSVYIHQYATARSEAAAVLPVSSIGNEYFTLCYRGLFLESRNHPSEFLIVATRDETNIEITLSNDTKGGRAAGSTYSIQLDRGETYQVQANNGFGDMTGSFISGDKDFALFAGNTWTAVPNSCQFMDNLMEQMYPIDTWGKKFVTVPSANVNYDVFRIQALEDNTTIQVYGEVDATYIIENAGAFKEYQRDFATFIESDKPIQVAQYNQGSTCSGHNVGDPSMLLLNSVEQIRDTVTLYNSSFQNITENYIHIVSASDDFDFVTFDGQPIPATAEIGSVGLNDEFSYARMQVNAGAHTIISDGCGVIVTAYGYGDLESYAYSGGASFKSINYNPLVEGGCLNDTITFDTRLSENRYSFLWDLGNGFTSTEAVFDYFYPNIGTYPAELILWDDCLGTVDTFYRDVEITLRQPLDAVGDLTVCEGDSFMLAATDLAGATFKWTGPNGYFSNEQFPKFNNASTGIIGEYTVVGTISGCATFPSYVEVGVAPIPIPELGPDTSFCNLENVLTLSPGIFANYLWQDNSTNNSIDINQEGTYSVVVTDQFGCVGIDVVTLDEICPTEIYIPNIFSPNDDGFNDLFEVYGHDIETMRLMIFDRFGSTIFESNSQAERWDGTFKGKAVAVGVYTWQLEFTGYNTEGDPITEVLSGPVTIVK